MKFHPLYRTRPPCCKCPERSLPDLFHGKPYCLYHLNVRLYGKRTADKIRAEHQAKQIPPPQQENK